MDLDSALQARLGITGGVTSQFRSLSDATEFSADSTDTQCSRKTALILPSRMQCRRSQAFVQGPPRPRPSSRALLRNRAVINTRTPLADFLSDHTGGCVVSRPLLPGPSEDSRGAERMARGARRPRRPGKARAAGARVGRAASLGADRSMERLPIGAAAAALHVWAVHGVWPQWCAERLPMKPV